MNTVTREDLNDLLQEADFTEVKLLVGKVRKHTDIRILQYPTQGTLMVPVSDPINQGRFYSGEVLATSTVVQVNGSNGWALIMDDNPDLSLFIAILDGAWESDCCREQIEEVALKAKKTRSIRQQRQQADVAATVVKFDLM